MAGLRKAGYKVSLDTRQGAAPFGTISARKGSKAFFINLDPKRLWGEGDVEVHFDTESAKRELTSRQHAALASKLQRLLYPAVAKRKSG